MVVNGQDPAGSEAYERHSGKAFGGSVGVLSPSPRDLSLVFIVLILYSWNKLLSPRLLFHSRGKGKSSSRSDRAQKRRGNCDRRITTSINSYLMMAICRNKGSKQVIQVM